ncbi:YCF48-related protein [Methylibium sp. T29]|uniref:WD40/YVTN/BNR-like repeat-containing protein n=1 Tax=Methylibium sp. T29 TaxID=1430884 RepID=UPI0003F42587|nr:YCF48-related protein [Methylibium sp. T29]EWS54691.1 Ycf48-like protein [Methylibium sp. T29]
MKPLLTALLASSLALAACVQAPDFGPVQAERAKPVQRNDTFQAASNNGKVLVAGTASGAIVVSSDVGKSWARQELAGPASVIALAACPDGGFVGIDFYRKLWIGDAAGQQWKAVPLDKQVDPMAVTCDPKGRIWVAGSHSTVLSSADRGATWNKQDFGEDAILTTIQFVDEQRGYITGEFGTVLTTSDGGANWTPLPAIAGDFYPYSTVFVDAQKAGRPASAACCCTPPTAARPGRRSPTRAVRRCIRCCARAASSTAWAPAARWSCSRARPGSASTTGWRCRPT